MISVLPTGVTSHSKTDSFGRKVFDELQLGTGFVSRQFSYQGGEFTEAHKENGKLKSTATTQLVSQIQFADGRTLSYEYDEEERITKVTEKVDGVETVTAYTYDAGGNPLSYRGYIFTWEKGRQLKSAVGNENNLSYTYNANGIRTSKMVNGEPHNYLLEGTKILREICLESDEETVKYVLNFLYDNEDSICGLTYNGTPYYFYKNLQGDVIAITDANGTVKANYSYDAWGVCTITKDESDCNIATINPFRYRGYYMDVETGMYYLQSRYYDAEVGRFVNCDDVMILAFGGGKSGHNLFVYCENNSANQKDSNGYIAANVVGAAIGAIIGVVGGVFLGNWLADVLKLSGWKRGIFIAAVAALVGAAAGVIGYFIGPYVAKIAVKLGNYILELLKKGKIAFQKLSKSVKSSIRAVGKCACFIAGTLVSTENGLVPIEKIVSGDKVKSENPNTGETGYKSVVKTFVNQVDTLVKLSFEEEIKTTMNHPFWVVGSGWKSASKLQLGDKVKRNDGTLIDVLGVEIVYLDTPVNVYNFEVADWHTYFVGNRSILVHNMCAKEFIRSPKNAKQVLKYLKEQGFKVVSQNGSHIKLTDGLKTTIVPNHGAKNIAIGTLKSIMKQAGLL